MAEMGPAVVSWSADSELSTSVRRRISCLSCLSLLRPLLAPACTKLGQAWLSGVWAVTCAHSKAYMSCKLRAGGGHASLTNGMHMPACNSASPTAHPG